MFNENELFNSEEEIESLFAPAEETETQEPGNPPEEKKEPAKKEPKDTTEEPPQEELDPENLFDENPESVGSEENENQEDANPSKKSAPYVFSSLAKALKEDGVLLDLSDEDVDGVKTPEDFSALITKQVEARLDEKQRRIDAALNNGIAPDTVRYYENTIQQLNLITEDQVKADDEKGENLRKQIIYRDYLNKGFSKERAEREVGRAITNGTDVEDAEEALKSIKEEIQNQYKKALEDADKAEKEAEQNRIKKAEALKKSILEDKNLFGEVELDKATRQKVLDNIVKPIYRDKESGETYSALQKFELDNPDEFMKKVGIVFTLTDGFKNFDGLIKTEVKKGVKKGMKELEHTLNNTQRNGDGSLNFASGTHDEDSHLSTFTLDV